jgi:hypothetical protein
MRVDRRFLYGGVFLLAIGAVLVAADLMLVDTAFLTNVLRLWPIAVIALGVGLVIRRTRYGVAGGLLAAALPGLVLGGTLAAAPRFAGDCGARGEPATVATERGTFDGPANVSVSSGCGSLAVSTAPGNGWQLDAANSAGRVPSVRSSSRSLSVGSIGNEGWGVLDGGRQNWHLTLPASDIDALSLVVNAGESAVGLPGARIGRLSLTGNASRIAVDASAASVANLSSAVRFGSLAINLPAQSDLVGSLSVGAGRLQVCAPEGLGLRVTSRGSPRHIQVGDVRQSGTEWKSPDYASAPHRADLRVSVNFGTVQINPIGGCR